MPEVPSFLVVLQNQSIVQDLEIFDLDGRQFVDGRSKPTEAAKLRFVFFGRLLEQLFVLGRCELVRGAFISRSKFRRTFDRFSIGKVSDGIVAPEERARSCRC